jgi:hypothetical protein
MNDVASFGDEMREAKLYLQCTNRERFPAAGKEDATMGTMAFLVAVGGVAAVILWLGARGQNRAAARRSSNDGSGADTSYTGGGGDGWSAFNWFGSHNSSSDSSNSSCDFSGSGSGGGDGGGGDGGGGGGD